MKLPYIFDKEFLNTYKEKHAIVMGIYAGLTEWKGIDDDVMQHPDVVGDEHYAKGGYIAGTILRYVMIITLLRYGVNII